MHDSELTTIDPEHLASINGGAFDWMSIVQGALSGFQQGGLKGALMGGGQAALGAVSGLLSGGGGGAAAGG